MKILNDTPFATAMFPGYRADGNLYVTVVIKATYNIREDGSTRKAIDQNEVSTSDVFDDSGVLVMEADTAVYKPNTDVVVIGKACSPNGVPTPSLEVMLRVGKMAKSVRVFGNRQWRVGGMLSSTRITEPEPFVEMDIGYANCYGGNNSITGAVSEENVIGKGYVGSKVKESQLEGVALPNLENPNKLIKSWKDNPQPHGLGIVSRSCLPRRALVGTYDEKWEQTRCPKPPLDYSEQFNNCAPVDQQVSGYLKGDEQVALENLSPTRPHLKFSLPGLQPRAVLQDQEVDFERPIDMVLDTLYLLPNDAQFMLVWRGSYAIADIQEMYFQTVLLKA